MVPSTVQPSDRETENNYLARVQVVAFTKLATERSRKQGCDRALARSGDTHHHPLRVSNLTVRLAAFSASG